MKFTVERAVLIKALAHVQSVVERRNTIPILANVLLAAQDDSLRLTATDMEIAVVEEVPGVRVARPGRTTAPAATLYEIVRKLPEGALVELEQGGGEAPLKLRAGRFHTDLAVLPVEDFPSMTEGKLPHRFTLGAGQMRDLVDRTRFAISTEETRYYLNGIYLHAAESDGAKVLRAVATDGHRLARFEEKLPEGAAGIPGVIVPRKTVVELRKLAEETQEPVEVAPVGHQDPLRPRRRPPHLQADRRHLPRIRPRHPARQRQGAARSTSGPSPRRWGGSRPSAASVRGR